MIKLLGLIILFIEQVKKKDNISYKSYLCIYKKVKIMGLELFFFNFVLTICMNMKIYIYSYFKILAKQTFNTIKNIDVCIQYLKLKIRLSAYINYY